MIESHTKRARRQSLGRLFISALSATTLFMVFAVSGWAQYAPGQEVAGTPPVVDWEAAAGGNMSFEVASIRTSKPNAESTSSFPLGPGSVYASTGGRFCATSTSTLTYIAFAYKLNNQQLQRLTSAVPGWVATDRFDVEARGPANPTKDQMRLIMPALLIERFNLALHREILQSPAFALIFVKNSKLGPQLQQHTEGESCAPRPLDATSPARPSGPSSVLELQLQRIQCGGIFALPPTVPGRLYIGAKDIPMSLLATWFTNPFTEIERPVFDRTGLTGTFDFSLEFSPAVNPAPPGLTPDPTGPTFMEALREQLGLKLESTTGQLDVIVVDHVEHPSEN